MPRNKWSRKKPPRGWEYIEPTMDALDRELRDAVDAPHEGKRKAESQWPIFQINWQRSRYIYDLYYKYKRISKQLYDYCVRNKIVDAPLIAKWKKPGYERLCSVHSITTSNQNFGTTSICRVPRQHLRSGQVVEAKLTGCRGCCSGPGGYNNIFGNKYGQYLAAIQVAREEAAAKRGEQYQQDKKKVFAEDHDEVEAAERTSQEVAKQTREESKRAANKSQDWLGAETAKVRHKRKAPVPDAGDSDKIDEDQAQQKNARTEEALEKSNDSAGNQEASENVAADSASNVEVH